VVRQKEFLYWNLRLSVDASSSRKLWRTLGSLMGSDKSKQAPKSCPTAQQLPDFFNAKVDAVRQSTGNCPAESTLQPSSVVFDTFEVCCEAEVQRTINSSQSNYKIVSWNHCQRMYSSSFYQNYCPTSQTCANAMRRCNTAICLSHSDAPS